MKSVLADRLVLQRLAGEKETSVGALVGHLLAVQAQDLRGAQLAIRARTTGLGASDVLRALEQRELVVSWCNRGTLHLVRAEDHPWLHALTTPQLRTSNLTRLRQEGVSPEQADRGVAVVAKELADGPRTRTRLKEVLQSADVPVAGQALVHLLFLATLHGVCVRGPVVGKEQAFVLVADWLPRSRPVDRDVALRELGRRYLAAHAHAAARDLAKWAGLTLNDARAALAGCALPVLPTAPLPPPTLLGPFDELLMGWESRDLVLDGHNELVTRNGIFAPFVMVRGKARGTWSLPRGRVAITPFDDLTPAVTRALARETADVERFLSS